MAADAKTAFGRYLRLVRERKCLSLEQVQSLSRSSVESINKGYLSRSENGRQSIAFTKVITLCRIYGVPSEALFERMELDMELDRVEGPATEGKSFQELMALGAQSYKSGEVWHVYGYFRDAAPLALKSPVPDRYASAKEQYLVCSMNVCSAALLLERTQLPLFELETIFNDEALTHRYRYLVADRLAKVHRVLKNLETARHYSELAINEAEQQDSPYLTALYSNRGIVALEEGDSETANDFFHKSYRLSVERGETKNCAVELMQLGSSFLAEGRTRAAWRSVAAAEKLARSNGIRRSLGFARLLMGRIASKEGSPEIAASHWKEASRIGRSLNDRVLRFKADLCLYGQALDHRELAVCRALERRLLRLEPWMAQEMPELQEFKELKQSNQSLQRQSGLR